MKAADYPFTVTIEVQFRDTDAMGHVNNAVYFTYMETARSKYVMRLMNRQGLEALQMILARACCSFRSPAFFGETLTVGVGISRIGNKSFDMVYRIEGPDGRLVAEGESTQVMYDYEAGHSIPVPAAFRARVAEVQGAWSPPTQT
nr:thioesterase family protein [Ardenticatena sp.]